jgi:hypothetical protein
VALLAAFQSWMALVGRSTSGGGAPAVLRPATHASAAAGGSLWPLVLVLVLGTLTAVVAALALRRHSRRRRAHHLQVQAVLSEVDRALGDPLLVLQARRRLHQARPSGER